MLGVQDNDFIRLIAWFLLATSDVEGGPQESQRAADLT